jgi:hypothetical protein
MTPSQPIWNSLEIVKLLASLLTPILLLLISIWVARLTERFKVALWTNQKVIEKRIDVYDKLAPMLNDLYCYFCYVGNWKEFTPIQIIEIKRKLDKTFYIYNALFSSEFSRLYFYFIHLCFETYTGPGKNAKLRTFIAGQVENRKNIPTIKWDDAWDEMFSESREVTRTEKIQEGYDALMACFAKELGIGIK